ncbi:MAG: AAA family ATPase [Alphaproteobacteria bacterium]|nr:AAA family ATPase [Alphaproteobacteria bacterium]
MITVVGNLKGGTGKSTVVFNLALWLAKQGMKVEVCDIDPQATLRDVAELRVEEGYTPTLSMISALPKRVTGEILVDIGTSDMESLRGALSRADRIVIPVSPSQADVWSTQRFLEIIAASSKKRPKLMAFVNRADTHRASRENEETEAALSQLTGLEVLPLRLGQRIVFRHSFSEGLGVFELEPSGKAAQELIALAQTLYGSDGTR